MDNALCYLQHLKDERQFIFGILNDNVREINIAKKEIKQLREYVGILQQNGFTGEALVSQMEYSMKIKKIKKLSSQYDINSAENSSGPYDFSFIGNELTIFRERLSNYSSWGVMHSIPSMPESIYIYMNPIHQTDEVDIVYQGSNDNYSYLIKKNGRTASYEHQITLNLAKDAVKKHNLREATKQRIVNNRKVNFITKYTEVTTNGKTDQLAVPLFLLHLVKTATGYKVSYITIKIILEEQVESNVNIVEIDTGVEMTNAEVNAIITGLLSRMMMVTNFVLGNSMVHRRMLRQFIGMQVKVIEGAYVINSQKGAGSNLLSGMYGQGVIATLSSLATLLESTPQTVKPNYVLNGIHTNDIEQKEYEVSSILKYTTNKSKDRKVGLAERISNINKPYSVTMTLGKGNGGILAIREYSALKFNYDYPDQLDDIIPSNADSSRPDAVRMTMTKTQSNNDIKITTTVHIILDITDYKDKKVSEGVIHTTLRKSGIYVKLEAIHNQTRSEAPGSLGGTDSLVSTTLCGIAQVHSKTSALSELSNNGGVDFFDGDDVKRDNNMCTNRKNFCVKFTTTSRSSPSVTLDIKSLGKRYKGNFPMIIQRVVDLTGREAWAYEAQLSSITMDNVQLRFGSKQEISIKETSQQFVYDDNGIIKVKYEKTLSGSVLKDGSKITTVIPDQKFNSINDIDNILTSRNQRNLRHRDVPWTGANNATAKYNGFRDDGMWGRKESGLMQYNNEDDVIIPIAFLGYTTSGSGGSRYILREYDIERAQQLMHTITRRDRSNTRQGQKNIYVRDGTSSGGYVANWHAMKTSMYMSLPGKNIMIKNVEINDIQELVLPNGVYDQILLSATNITLWNSVLILNQYVVYIKELAEDNARRLDVVEKTLNKVIELHQTMTVTPEETAQEESGWDIAGRIFTMLGAVVGMFFPIIGASIEVLGLVATGVGSIQQGHIVNGSLELTLAGVATVIGGYKLQKRLRQKYTLEGIKDSIKIKMDKLKEKFGTRVKNTHIGKEDSNNGVSTSTNKRSIGKANNTLTGTTDIEIVNDVINGQSAHITKTTYSQISPELQDCYRELDALLELTGNVEHWPSGLNLATAFDIRLTEKIDKIGKGKMSINAIVHGEQRTAEVNDAVWSKCVGVKANVEDYTIIRSAYVDTVQKEEMINVDRDIIRDIYTANGTKIVEKTSVGINSNNVNGKEYTVTQDGDISQLEHVITSGTVNDQSMQLIIQRCVLYYSELSSSPSD
ncbi:unnamed protein product [Diadromus pulchellus idnoreovirus 1]|uniref:Uncharacterized protein S3 n=1 Tax=Diadromus pulchellus idnoreovirus 1 TaxID=37368 RepID=S3_DPIRV|nr:unnamed protein product [Diadromus pulchellus idnoreovirus 1]Q85444.1 RecName: Full=Uncharacterized protein S3 [Diadromus pulchellus idnoreovirus 1]CAA56651.1 unnamed protein product [Diadromus pulchellus idnoreovirus 1]